MTDRPAMAPRGPKFGRWVASGPRPLFPPPPSPGGHSAMKFSPPRLSAIAGGDPSATEAPPAAPAPVPDDSPAYWRRRVGELEARAAAAQARVHDLRALRERHALAEAEGD